MGAGARVADAARGGGGRLARPSAGAGDRIRRSVGGGPVGGGASIALADDSIERDGDTGEQPGLRLRFSLGAGAVHAAELLPAAVEQSGGVDQFPGWRLDSPAGLRSAGGLDADPPSGIAAGSGGDAGGAGGTADPFRGDPDLLRTAPRAVAASSHHRIGAIGRGRCAVEPQPGRVGNGGGVGLACG